MMLQAKSAGWQQLATVPETAKAFPKRMRALLEALDLSRSDMGDVRQHWQAKNLEAALSALVNHYRKRKWPAWMLIEEPGEHDTATREGEEPARLADDILNDIDHGFGEKGRIPRDKSGHLNWTHRGPKGDLQFACRVNRHGHLLWLLKAFRQTGQAQYARRIDLDLRDWLIASGGSANPKNFGPGRLEAALRMPTWTRVFFELPNEKAFHPSTGLLLLSALPAHAQYLQASLKPTHNFATMQMHGLGTLGLAFPEFKDAEKWHAFAMKQMTREIKAQVYPDGVQKELTSSYHWVALRQFDKLAEKAERSGKALPAAYRASLEKMYAYMAGSVRPDGCCPLNNDSDRSDRLAILAKAAERFQRPDWTWIASNGKQGAKPKAPPSRFYPWAGQLISRSGWDRDAQWSFFDLGPFGISHQHHDKLHLSIHAYGRDLLVDGGRFAYQGELAACFLRPYAYVSRSHNVILVDGFGQHAPAHESKSPLSAFRIDEAYDFALGSFRRGFDPNPTRGNQRKKARVPMQHFRAVLYLRNKGWIVVDHLVGSGTKKHTLTPLWHFHPNCTMAVQGHAVASTDAGKGNLHIQPLGDIAWQVAIVKGQEKPALQGWYSERYGMAQPSPCAVYKAAITDRATFGWVLTPGRDTPKPLKIEWLKAPAGIAHLKTENGRHIWIVMDPKRLPATLPDGRKLEEHLLMESRD